MERRLSVFKIQDENQGLVTKRSVKVLYKFQQNGAILWTDDM